MTAIHLRAPGLRTDRGKARAEIAVSRVVGVADVVAVKSMHLVSVLFDETRTTAGQILYAIRRAGIDARLSTGPREITS